MDCVLNLLGGRNLNFYAYIFGEFCTLSRAPRKASITAEHAWHTSCTMLGHIWALYREFFSGLSLPFPSPVLTLKSEFYLLCLCPPSPTASLFSAGEVIA